MDAITKGRIQSNLEWTPFKLVLVYLIVGSLWILLSDILLSTLTDEIGTITRLQTFQGWFFILLMALPLLVTALPLYVYSSRSVRAILNSEAALRKERDSAQMYLDIARVIFIALDANGKITLVNKRGCEILGHNDNEIIGKNWFDAFLPKRLINEMKTNYVKLMDSQVETAVYYENPVVTSSGEERIIAWHITILKDESGVVNGTLSSGNDITERLKMEELARTQQAELIQADKMASLGILVSGVVHEINNPNNYILLNAKIIMRAWSDITPILRQYYQDNDDFVIAGMSYSKACDTISQLISGIVEGTERIQNIVQNMKDYAREEKGNMDQLIDMNAVVESANVIIQSLVKKSTQSYSVTYDKDLPRIRGNYQYLEQVIINLITNSCQALQNSDQSIDIAISLEDSKKNICIQISDEGEGITPENLRQILNPFYTTKRESGGTGLGLSISYNIIKEHGGQLNFISELGKGTTAIITLPVP